MRVRALTTPFPRTAAPRARSERAGLVFPLRADVSWLLTLGLGTWTLADAVLPAAVEGRATSAYWTGGFVAALGLAASLALHEAGHCWAARRAGLATRGIVLSAFGGIATLDGEPPTPRAALAIAVSGPLASLAVAGSALAAHLVMVGVEADPLSAMVVALIAVGNGFVALVNLVPALPLDGGHALRALLWGAGLEPASAMRTAQVVARGLGVAMIGLAVIASASGDVPVALWSALLGLVVLTR